MVSRRVVAPQLRVQVLYRPEDKEGTMPKGKKIESLDEIMRLVDDKRSIVSQFGRRHPAAVIQNWQLRVVFNSIKNGLYVYEKAEAKKPEIFGRDEPDSSEQDSRILKNSGITPLLLEIDGHYEKERYLIKIDGIAVFLTGKSFSYLFKLTANRLLNGANSWLDKYDIEPGENQTRYLYRLRQEIKSAGISWKVYENDHRGGYRLDMELHKIRTNVGELKTHPDHEIVEIAKEIRGMVRND